LLFGRFVFIVWMFDSRPASLSHTTSEPDTRLFQKATGDYDMAARIGIRDFLIREKRVTPPQLEQALHLQREKGGTLINALIQIGLLSQEDAVALLSKYHGVQAVDLTAVEIGTDVLKLIPARLARSRRLIPITRTATTLSMAMANPSDVFAIEDVRFMTGLNVAPLVADETAIAETIDKYYSPEFPPPASRREPLGNSAADTRKAEALRADALKAEASKAEPSEEIEPQSLGYVLRSPRNPPPPAASYGSSDIRSTVGSEWTDVAVLYATDRGRTDYGGELRYGILRGGARLAYGSAVVSIPATHKRGNLERPSIWRFQLREEPRRHVVVQEVTECEKVSFFRRSTQAWEAYRRDQHLSSSTGTTLTSGKHYDGPANSRLTLD
jgi:hypothetical protein